MSHSPGARQGPHGMRPRWLRTGMGSSVDSEHQSVAWMASCRKQLPTSRLPLQIGPRIGLLQPGSELSDEFGRLLVELLGYGDEDFGVQVTRASVGGLDSLPLSPQPRAAAGAGRNFERDRAMRRRHVDLGAQ